MGILLNAATICGVLGLFLYTIHHFSLNNAIIFFVISFLVSLISELMSIKWGVPFLAKYTYHPALKPFLFNNVPLFIPLAWYVISFVPHVFLKYLPVLVNKKRSIKRIFIKAFLCTLFMLGIDVFLEPLAVFVNAWSWHIHGAYFGIPFTNFLGWFLSGFITHIIYLFFEKPYKTVDSRILYILEVYFILYSTVLTTMGLIKTKIHIHSIIPFIIALFILLPFWIFWFFDFQKRIQKYTRVI
ncbi:carotenoid biosynthesis protein [bacterium]|nr:carotenoid biosynthesis protein [bacterium]